MAQLKQPTSRDLVITYVKGEGPLLKFWGLPVSSLDIVKKYEAQFAKAQVDLERTNGFLNSNQTPVGFKGAVFSKFKRRWCRARVLQVRGYTEVLVQLLDYGNEEVVSVGDFRILDESYFRLLPQALECILADVIPSFPNEWSSEAIRFCEQHLVCQTVSCCIVSQHLRRLGNDIVEKVPVVRIAKKGEIDPFVQRLINGGLAYIKPEGPHHQMPPQQQPPPLPIQPSYKMQKLDPNTTHIVRISFIENAQKFYVQLAAAELELKQLMDEIKNYTVTESMSLLHAPLVNTPCLAQFSSKQVFYRAVITAVVHGRCSVLFVDYGCSELKDFQELRALPNHFLGLQAQAICCSLKPGDTGSEECFITGKFHLLNCHVLGFNSEAFVVRLTPPVPEFVPHRPIPRALTPPAPPMVYRRQTLDVGSSYDVTVSFINDVSEFYCQLAHFKAHLDMLSTDLNGNNFEAITLNECLPNMPVCVKYSEDNQWYRAQVIKVNHERDIEVFFVDFGNYDNAYLQNVRRLKTEFMLLPVQAFKCCLFETESSSDSNVKDDMFAFFEEITVDQALSARVQAVTDGQCYVVTLEEPNATMSINEKIQMKFASIGTIPVSEVELLCVTSFTSPDLFFTQFCKVSDDKLNLMQDKINEFYLTQRNTAFRPSVGSYVCAKYAVDGQFYRALVENIRGMECNVFFIDYGNREVVTVQNVHPMQKEFMACPQFGIECGLETFPPATPVEKLKIMMEGNSFQARMIREQNKKWIISLTENNSKNVAILEFLRQHENIVARSIHGAGLQGFQGNVPKRDDSYPAAITGRNGYQNAPSFDSAPSQRNENLSRDPKKELSKQLFDVISIPLKATRNVYVSYVVSPSEFYVQIEEESSKLDTLMSQIEESYTNNTDEDLNFVKLTVDAPCCAMFEDETWYRGQVKKVGVRDCSIYFVDYGNTDSVPTPKVKVLQKQFFSLPPQAVRCMSHGVSPKNGTWSDSDIDTFSNMTLEKSFVAQFVESDGNGGYSVNLVSTSKLQEDILNKEFASLVQGRSEPKQPAHQPVVQEARAAVAEVKPKQNPHVAAPVNVRLLPPNVRIGSEESIVVPYGLNPGEVFCQLKTLERDFKEMMFNMQSYYNKVSATEAIISNPNQNMVCIAQFFQDMAWYRAEIKNVDRNSLTVCFVDYGNCETVDKQKVRSITQEFASLPIQAIKCRLKGIRPPGQSWPVRQDISKYFEGESQCHFIDKDGDCFLVDILCNNRSVAQQLVRDGVAASDAPAASNVPIAKQSIPNQFQENKFSGKQSIPARETRFVPGQLLSVVASFVESPCRFWCQLLDESEGLEQLMADIGVQYQSDNPPIDVANMTVGSYCMAKYSEDDAWYRAQIKSSVPAGEYEVFFIDYGNSEVNSSNQLATIKEEFLALPPQCFECKLHRSPTSCDTQTVEKFQGVVNEAEELTAKVEKVANNVCVLTLLYEKEAEEINLSDELFGEAADAPSMELVKFLNPDVPLGPQEGYVTEVVTPRDFFIQLAGIEDDLADLSTRLSDECEAAATSGSEEVLRELTVGCACSAKYAEDNNWYRAEVIGLQESTADILFVDYGNTNSVPRDSLRVLGQSFLATPPYAIRCRLNGIVPAGDQWTDDAVSSFRDMVLDAALGLTFISKDVPATVNILRDDKDVAQSLVDLELAAVDTCPETEEAYVDDHLATVEDQLHSLPSDLGYPKRKLTSAKLPVKICYVHTHDTFYCMPLELSTELDTVMKTLEILYSPPAESSSAAQLGPLEDPAALMACVAKYSEDETWYRAVITEIGGDEIGVAFVDYGNSELTTLENLRPLTPELIKIPPIAVECSLYAVQALEGKEQELMAKLEELCLEEVELEMETVLVGASYSVRLHNHEGDLSDLFVKEGLAIVVTPPPESADDALVEDLNEKVIQNLKTAFVETEEMKNVVPLQSVSLDKDLLVSIKFSEIENETVVFYAVPNDLEDSLADFQDKLQNAYNQIEGRLEKVASKDFCVAKYAEDEMWYRAQVVSCEGNEIRVKFIDYGNSEIVPLDSIGELLPEFLSEPQFSIKFCLSGCRVRQDKSEELQGKMDEHFYEEPVLVKVCKYLHSVPAVCVVDIVCGEIHMVDLLLKEKLLLHQFTVNPQLNDKFEATVESIVDNVFYILPVEFKEDRDKLQSRLLDACDASASAGEIDPGRLYAANLEKCWYRVAISAINVSSESAFVKCLDYGLDAELEFSKLMLLPEELCHYPLLLQPCLIANTEKALEIVESQEIEKISGRVFQCEVLNVQPLQFPLEIKISDKDLDLDAVQEIETEDDKVVCNRVDEAVAIVDEAVAIVDVAVAIVDVVADNVEDVNDEAVTNVDFDVAANHDKVSAYVVDKVVSNIDEVVTNISDEAVVNVYDVAASISDEVLRNVDEVATKIYEVVANNDNFSAYVEDKVVSNIDEVATNISDEAVLNVDKVAPSVSDEVLGNIDEVATKIDEVAAKIDKVAASFDEFVADIVGEVTPEMDVLKSMEEDLAKYSNLVSEIEKDRTTADKTVDELISSIDVSKTDDEKGLSVAEGLCNATDLENETNSDIFMSEDELEEQILKKEAYLCGKENEEEEEAHRDSEFEEFQADEGEGLGGVLKETDSFIEEMENLAHDLKMAAGDFYSAKNQSLKDGLNTAADSSAEKSPIDDLVPEEDFPAHHSDSAENKFGPTSNELSIASHEDSAARNGLEDENSFGFGDPDSVAYHMPSVDDSTLSRTEDEFKETESQFPESEVNFTVNQKNIKEGVQSAFANMNDAVLKEATDNFSKSEVELKSHDIECVESDKLDCVDYIESTESCKSESHDNTESSIIDKLESPDTMESTESDKLDNLESTKGDNTESSINEKLENPDTMESTESDKLENLESSKRDNTESSITDKLESPDTMESTESDKLDNLESTKRDKLKNLDSTESTESDKLKNPEIIRNNEFVESDILKRPGHVESAESDKKEIKIHLIEDSNIKTDYEDIPRSNSDDTDSAEDLAESSKLEENPTGSAVEDNEWDERPECDIKPEQVIEDKDIPNQKSGTHEGLLRDLISTPWHKCSGRLKGAVTGIEIQDGTIAVKIEPSPEELGLVLFNTHKDMYDVKSCEILDVSVSNLYAVRFNNDWYRAKVLDLKEDTLIVSLIDSGMTETVQQSAVKDLEAEHNAPLISAQCSLSNAYCSSKESSTTKDFLNALLKDTNKDMFIELVGASDSGKIEINLLLGGENVLYRLLSEKHAIQKISPSTIPPGQHSVKLSHSRTHSELYVHLVSQFDDLMKLKDSMQVAYPSSNAQVPMVESGMYALKHDGVWVRGEAVSSEKELVLRLVDIGETIPASCELYPLLPEHCLHPPYAVPCRISAGISLTNEVLERAKEVLGTSEFLVNIEMDSMISSVTAALVDQDVVKKIFSTEKSDCEEV